MRKNERTFFCEFAVTKETYEIDVVLLDRYQSFSAGLLHVALLALTGYGALFSSLPQICLHVVIDIAHWAQLVIISIVQD